MTNSSSNVHLDGNGNLDITALEPGRLLDIRPDPDDQRQRGRPGGR